MLQQRLSVSRLRIEPAELILVTTMSTGFAAADIGVIATHNTINAATAAVHDMVNEAIRRNLFTRTQPGDLNEAKQGR